MTLMVLGNGGIKISTFGTFLMKTRGKKKLNGHFHSAGSCTRVLGTQLQRASAWPWGS